MARAQIPLVVTDDNNPPNLLSGAVVEVRRRSDGGLLTVFAAETGATTVANPVTTDSAGVPVGWVDTPQRVNFVVSHAVLATRTYGWDAISADDLGQARQVRTFNSGGISIPNSSATTISWDSEIYDLPGNDQHSTVTNTDRIVCVQDGAYLVSASMSWAVNATGYRKMVVQRNGINNDAGSTISAADDSGQSLTFPMRLVAGDYYKLLVTQTSGGALNFSAFNFLAFVRVSS